MLGTATQQSYPTATVTKVFIVKTRGLPTERYCPTRGMSYTYSNWTIESGVFLRGEEVKLSLANGQNSSMFSTGSRINLGRYSCNFAFRRAFSEVENLPSSMTSMR